MEERVLIFNVSRKWYDLYRSGAKREEYRGITEHWDARLGDKEFDIVEIRCGYPPKGGRPETPNLRFKWTSTVLGWAKEGIGRELFGMLPCFVVHMEDLPTSDPCN